MKIALILAVAALVGCAVFFMNQPTDNFDAWKAKYGKDYNNDIEVYRREIFNQNLAKIEAHNANPSATYSMAVNQFMDLTPVEFKYMHLGLNKGRQSGDRHYSSGNADDEVDWTKKGAVTPVKDQGQCGSCWAFSTTGSLEGVNFIATKKLDSYAEQMLVDCSGSYGNMGCNGGLMDYAFKFVIDNGIVTEDKYPYKAVDQKCKIESGPFKIKSYKDVNAGDCDDLKDAVTGQPTSVAVDAMNWQFYSGGIFSDCGTSLDHGVLAVGYSTKDGYWKIKNSWATSWGEQGFIRLKEGNTCGLCNQASYPVV